MIANDLNYETNDYDENNFTIQTDNDFTNKKTQ